MLSCLEAKLEILFGLLSLTKGCRYFCVQLAKTLRAHARLWLGIDLAFEACSRRHRKAAFVRHCFWNSQQMGAMGKAEQWAVSWGGTRGEHCGEGRAGIHPNSSGTALDHSRKGGRRLRSCPSAVSSPSPEHHPTALSPPGLGRQQRQPQGAWAAEKLMARPDTFLGPVLGPSV